MAHWAYYRIVRDLPMPESCRLHRVDLQIIGAGSSPLNASGRVEERIQSEVLSTVSYLG
jgi:hypothetical protein